VEFYPERLHQAETRLDALDIWRQWAQGHRVDRDQLADSVESLGHSPEAATNGTLALANAVRQWAEHNRVDVTPVPSPIIERVDLGIDIDF
jgi:hypothetical protein